MNMIKKTAVAALAVTVIATGSLATASQAQAGKFKHGAAIGLGLGLLGGLAIANHHNRTTHYTTRRCWWEEQVRYDRYGDPYYKDVKVCTR